MEENIKQFIMNCKRRLSSCSQKDGLFPLAGQDYRNKIIKMFEFLEKEMMPKSKKKLEDKNE